MCRSPTPPPGRTFALVDCQSFYVSCERLFAPALEGRPVGVLSNNDGCIIARSLELKAHGIPMGAPYFKFRKQLDRIGARLFSSNYTLYADLSRRVMETLRTVSDALEVYSIDEAFLHVPPLEPAAQEDLAWSIRARVLRWTGIPVRVSVGPTKTLAKLAARRAKQTGTPVYCLPDDPADDLAAVAVGDVWGIGKRRAALLERHGLHTALALARARDAWARQAMTVVGLRTVHELRGTSCLPLEQVAPARKSLVHSRMFGRKVTARRDLETIVSAYASRAGEKLRRHRLVAHQMLVWITTGPYAARPYSNTAAVPLAVGTSDTIRLARAARRGLDTIFRPGFDYTKAGITLLELTPASAAQDDLFAPNDPRRTRLMEVLDAVNRTQGRGTLVLARSMAAAPDWQAQFNLRSPRYTTRWDELPTARC